MKSILDLMSKLPKLPEGEDIRMTGTMAAVQALGMDTVTEMPVLVNFGVLKQLVGNKPPMLSMRSAASTLIHTTDLHSLPSEPPAILRTPLIVQASKARRPLFGQTLGLACYELDDCRYLIGLTSEGAAIVVQWTPRWSGGDIDDSVKRERSLLLDGITAGEHQGWGQAAAQYLITLGILLDADNSPLELRPIKKSKHNERGVFYEPRPGESVFEAPGEAGKLSASVQVTGHLKRQHFGPGNTYTRWIWVSQYAARRWVSHLSHVVDRA